MTVKKFFEKLDELLHNAVGLKIVRWKCRHCKHLHRWFWDWEEVRAPGVAKMCCDMCQKNTVYSFDGTGGYKPDYPSKKK